MSNPKHSPLPWYDSEHPTSSVSEIRDADGLLVNFSDRAIALRTLTACNAYPRLAAALKDLIAVHEVMKNGECFCGGCVQARALLAELEGR